MELGVDFSQKAESNMNTTVKRICEVPIPGTRMMARGTAQQTKALGKQNNERLESKKNDPVMEMIDNGRTQIR